MLTLPVLTVGILLVLLGAAMGTTHASGLPSERNAWYLAMAAAIVALHVATGLVIRAAAHRMLHAGHRRAARWGALSFLLSGGLWLVMGEAWLSSRCDDFPPCGFAVGAMWALALIGASWVLLVCLCAFAVTFARFVWTDPQFGGD
jgi:hypothetical protein